MSLVARVRRSVARTIHGPKIRTDYTGPLVRLGSEYGGWVFAETDDLHGGSVVSCGLGEDASFDVEFAARFGATVVLVDPTPRAIEHYEQLIARAGERRTAPYAAGGQQPVEAYDLSNVGREQLVLVPKAVTESVGVVRFYAPPNPSDVSHSVVNFQNDYSADTPFIEVESIDFPGLLREASIPEPVLVKFDIEGAEIAVIPHLLDAGLRPHQVLVEYDELSRPSQRSRRNFDGVHQRLLAVGYMPIHFDGRTCVSYLLGGET